MWHNRTFGSEEGRVPYTTERAIRAARAQGKGILKIAREVGVGTATVQRVIGDL